MTLEVIETAPSPSPLPKADSYPYLLSLNTGPSFGAARNTKYASAMSSSRCNPRQRVSVPGSPSPLRPRKPPPSRPPSARPPAASAFGAARAGASQTPPAPAIHVPQNRPWRAPRASPAPAWSDDKSATPPPSRCPDRLPTGRPGPNAASQLEAALLRENSAPASGRCQEISQ